MCEPTSSLLRHFNIHNSHPVTRPVSERGFVNMVKGKALHLLRTNSSETLSEKKIKTFKTRLAERGYPRHFIEKKNLSKVKFQDRSQALQQKQKENKRILPFVTLSSISVKLIKEILKNKAQQDY